MGEVRVLQNLWAANRDLQAHPEGYYGLYGPVCEFLVVAGQYWCLPPHQLILHLWDSPRRKVILQCWYVKDQDVLDCWCSPIHQKVAWH
ncbi:unnamed protein product [Staurois parvus]|uniref:Uncharacterized protein n=1 Tax=Staurois parvus TaxID=386267 RepID=A0ABN9FF16_9NEOB|nr:unnamed protein product [Staurois parvus]